METNPTVGPIFSKIVADRDLVAIAVAIYQNGPARLNGKTIETLMKEAVLKTMGRDSHVRKNFLPRPPNNLKFSDLVEKITEVISILV